MVSDDTYRKLLNGFIAALDAWATDMRPWADIEFGPAGGAWRIRAEPHVASACPFEAVIRPDRKFDIVVDGAEYEDLPLDGINLPQVLRAIADGRIVIRHWSSTVTGLPYSVETLVDLPGGEVWRAVKSLTEKAPAAGEELMARTTAFVPYRR
jgi:hypothetical protein